MTFSEREIFDFKIKLAKDLEKRIKMGYKNQFRNIVISITSMPKRYKKIKAPLNISMDVQKLDTINQGILNYLMDMFDVFGENAILNAKRIFEDNGTKWGKRFYKSYNQSYNAGDIKKLVKELYLNDKDIDYISMSNHQLSWVFKSPDVNCGLSSHFPRYFNILHEVKSIWLQHFVKAIAPGHICVLELLEESENQIVTNITIKMASTEIL